MVTRYTGTARPALCRPRRRRAPASRIGIVPTVPAASPYLAVDKGYFREAGIEAKMETVNSASKIVPFLAHNQVRVAQGGIAIGRRARSS